MQKTTFWLSSSDDFFNYAEGVKADDSIEYTIASRALNEIEWLADMVALFAGASGSEFVVQGSAQGAPLGGDTVPLVQRTAINGSAAVQPVPAGRHLLYIDRSYRKIFALIFDIYVNGWQAQEVTTFAEHITAPQLVTCSIGFAKKPDPRLFFIRSDGQLVTLTYYELEKVIAFTRYVTDGLFESVAVIPQGSGLPDQVWVTVQRTVNGQTKRFVELFDTEASATRLWGSMNTDCGLMVTPTGGTSVTVSHLVGKTVDIVADGNYKGTMVVPTSGTLMLAEAATQVEVGLHYDSTLVTMRPAVEGAMVEGLPRTWIKLWVRVKDSIGGLCNGQRLNYVPAVLNSQTLNTLDVEAQGLDAFGIDGRITIKQDQPYPLTVLAVFGEIDFGEHG